MTWFGALLTTLAGIGLGLYYSRRLYRRVGFLWGTGRVLETLSGRLTYAPLPMADLWRGLATGELGDFSLVADTALGLQAAPFPAAFRQAVEQAVAGGLLTDTDKQLLLEFGEGCGRLGLAGQAAHIRAYRQQVEAAAQEARQQATAKAQVYQMLGVAGGGGLSLLLR